MNRKASIAALAAALTAVALYWPTLSLPLLYDDLLHIRLVTGAGWLDIWRPTDAFAFYRPLVFLPFLFIRSLFGHYPASLLHALNIAQHALNAALLAWLAWRLWRHAGRALLAGLLLAVFPFGYQAVVIYANNIYPASATWTLLALHTYLSGLHDGRRRWWLLTGLIFLVYTFSHETAVLLGPLAALLHLQSRGKSLLADGVALVRRPLLLRRTETWRDRPWLVLTAAGILYALVWQALPTGVPPQTDFGGNDPVIKALYFLQIGAYPLTWFAHRLPDWPAATLIAVAAAVTALWSLWAALEPTNRPALLLGWGWWALASLLLALPLPTYYLTNGARLLYLGAVGLVLAWTVLISHLARHGRPGTVAALAFATFLLVSNAAFVRDRLAAYEAIAAPVQLMREVTAARPPESGVLFVNLPSWTAPPRNVYPIGAEFVTLMGGHLFVEELVVENQPHNRPARAIQVDELLADPGYGYGVHRQGDYPVVTADWAPAGSDLFLTRYTPDGLPTAHAGRFAPATGDPAPLARLGPYRLLNATAVRCPGRVRLETAWQPNAEPGPTLSLFVQLIGDDGRLLAQADAPPLQLPTARLAVPAGWTAVDYRALPFPPDALPPAHILLGVYDFTTGERATAVDRDGNALPDNALTVPLAPCDGDR